MPLTLRQIRQNCHHARSAMERARKENFALGAFNIDNQETLVAICRAAKVKNAPVLVEVSHSEVEALGIDNVRNMVDNYRDEFGVEVYINLDHSPSVLAAKEGIEAGFEFIHIDISHGKHDASDEEIIAGTREIVAYARLTGALVESEPHYFEGGSNVYKDKIDYEEIKKTFSTPDNAREFVATTGVDTFAAAIGNLHGKYPVPKKLDIDLLKSIRKSLSCNISLHGGSGTPGHYFEKAVRVGVSKININTDMRIAYRKTLERVLVENKSEYAVVKLMGEVIAEVQKVVESKIDMFNASGKAVLD